jgi:hypothetical protein
VNEELSDLPRLLRSNLARSKAYLQSRLTGVTLAATDEGTGWNVDGEWNLLPDKVDVVEMVARDGIEPPTPAFSGPRSTS